MTRRITAEEARRIATDTPEKQVDIPEIDGYWDYNDRSVMTRDSQTGQWREATPVEIMTTLLRLEQGINRLVPAVVRECADSEPTDFGVE